MIEVKSELLPSYRPQFIGGLFQTDLDPLTVPWHTWVKILHHPSVCCPSVTAYVNTGLADQGLVAIMPDPTVPGSSYLTAGLAVSIILPAHLKTHLNWWAVEMNILGGVSLT